jgi:hypothetical protein
VPEVVRQARPAMAEILVAVTAVVTVTGTGTVVQAPPATVLVASAVVAATVSAAATVVREAVAATAAGVREAVAATAAEEAAEPGLALAARVRVVALVAVARVAEAALLQAVLAVLRPVMVVRVQVRGLAGPVREAPVVASLRRVRALRILVSHQPRTP